MSGDGLLLGSVGIFADVREDDVATITEAAQSLSFAPGEVLIRAGDKGDEVYVVTDGRFRVTRHEDDNEVHVGDVLPGECVGEMAVLRDAPRTATVTAVQDSKVLCVPGSRLRELMKCDKAFRTSVEAHVAHIERWTTVRRYRPSAEEVVDRGDVLARVGPIGARTARLHVVLSAWKQAAADC